MVVWGQLLGIKILGETIVFHRYWDKKNTQFFGAQKSSNWIGVWHLLTQVEQKALKPAVWGNTTIT